MSEQLNYYFPEQYAFSNGSTTAFCTTFKCEDSQAKLYIVDQPNTQLPNPTPYVVGTAKFNNIQSDWNYLKYDAQLAPDKTITTHKNTDIAQLNTMLSTLTTVDDDLAKADMNSLYPQAMVTGYFDSQPTIKTYSYDYFNGGDPDKRGYFNAINNLVYDFKCGNEGSQDEIQKSRILKDFYLQSRFDGASGNNTGTFGYDVFYKCVDVNPYFFSRANMYLEDTLNIYGTLSGSTSASPFLIEQMPEDIDKKKLLLQAGATNILIPSTGTFPSDPSFVSNLTARHQFQTFADGDQVQMKTILDPVLQIVNPQLDAHLQIQLRLAIQNQDMPVNVLNNLQSKTEEGIRTAYNAEKVKYSDGPEMYPMYPAIFSAFQASGFTNGVSGFLQNVYPEYDTELGFMKVYRGFKNQ